MIQFIRNIWAAYLFVRSFRHIARTEPIGWRDDDTVACARFFDHGSGQKLLLRLETGAVNMALEAAQLGNEHACGIARGAILQLEAIKSHSQFSRGPAYAADTEESEQQARLDDFASTSA